jgi:hypothetical protein
MTKTALAALLGGIFTLSAVAQTCSLKVADIGSWGGTKVQVIPKKTDTACLIAYAAKLTREHPGVRYEFYDSQTTDLIKYIRGQRLLLSPEAESVLRDGAPPEYQYSPKALSKHHIANLWAGSDLQSNAVVDKDGCQSWVLKSGDDKTLATFDHVCPAR